MKGLKGVMSCDLDGHGHDRLSVHVLSRALQRLPAGGLGQ